MSVCSETTVYCVSCRPKPALYDLATLVAGIHQDPVQNRAIDHKLTLYSCTLQGSGDGRDVFEAKLVGEVKVE